ncbi:MAG: exodeoxyribonuclease VII small subunit [Desulfobacteraceae bacterium 4572_35.2]|nr:MAG: exodeoxyribonuclease VII small subunit [Desulfobacteraceae bacterium 4572_35.2]
MAKAIAFENSLETLEECVRRLEQEDLPIDDAFQLFETGVKSAQRCQKSLQNIETKVEKLMNDHRNQFTTEPLKFTD